MWCDVIWCVCVSVNDEVGILNIKFEFCGEIKHYKPWRIIAIENQTESCLFVTLEWNGSIQWR